MKVVILSDTHGSTQAVERVFSEQPDAALYLHAGDVLGDAEYMASLVGAELNAGEQDESVSPRVIGVPGNTDWPDGNQPLARIVCAAGHRILLAHGHSFGVQYTTKFFADAAAESNCDIAVYELRHRGLRAHARRGRVARDANHGAEPRLGGTAERCV